MREGRVLDYNGENKEPIVLKNGIVIGNLARGMFEGKSEEEIVAIVGGADQKC